MTIDHIGIVVPNLAEGIRQWTGLFGYRQATESVENSRQKVRVVFMAKEGSGLVKLVEPTGEGSPVWRYSRKGGGLHHICFRCDDVGAEVKRLKAAGLHVLSEPAPGEAFDGGRIAFVFAGQGLNIELIDTQKKAKLISSDPKERPSS